MAARPIMRKMKLLITKISFMNFAHRLVSIDILTVGEEEEIRGEEKEVQ